MLSEEFIEYKRREFCKDIKCPNQIELNGLKEKTMAYEKIRKSCMTCLLYTSPSPRDRS